MDLETDAGRLLDQLDVLRHASDLDLLMFFARHPRTLLASEHIAAFLGYGVNEIAASLELLVDAGFLTRTPDPRHVARMYVLADAPPGNGWLPALKRLASTRDGRLALIWEIRRRYPPAPGGSTPRTESADKGRTAVTGDSRQQQQTASTNASSEPRKQSKRSEER
jgi:hypothetical protein